MLIKAKRDKPRIHYTCDCGNQLAISKRNTQSKPIICECKRIYFYAENHFQVYPGDVKPALCLDLDGTIRYSKNGEFINKPEDVVLFSDAEERIWEYRDQGYLIFGITNQGGVAHEFKSILGYNAEIEETIQQFERNPFHIIKACFHHPDGTFHSFAHRSLLRKPDVGMLALCEIEAWEAGYIVDWDNSLMVGDRPEDQQLAQRAGIAFQWATDFFNRG